LLDITGRADQLLPRDCIQCQARHAAHVVARRVDTWFCSAHRRRASAAVLLRPTLENPAMGLWSKKSIALLQSEAAAEGSEVTLKRALGALNLTMLGIGAIIGAGIFVLTGTAAAQYAGPGIV